MVLLILRITTWLGAQEIFLLKEVKLEGNRFIERKELFTYFQIDSTKNIFDIDLKAIENQIKKHPLVQEVTISRHLPSLVKIKIKEKQPLAVINSSELFAIDESGYILPKVNPAIMCDYPIISNLNFKKDQFNKMIISTELSEILHFLKNIKKKQYSLYSRISEISYSNKVGIYFYLTDGTIPVLLGKESLGEKGANLMTVLKLLQKTEKLAQVEYFDLRFRNQVIVKEKGHS